MINKILGSSPRTTLMGYIAAIATAIWPLLQGNELEWKNILIAAGLALWGRIQKDSNGITRHEGQQMLDNHEEIKKVGAMETPTDKVEKEY